MVSLSLRIEDTDLERSKKEFEESQISDLEWFGMDYDEGQEKKGLSDLIGNQRD